MCFDCPKKRHGEKMGLRDVAAIEHKLLAANIPEAVAFKAALFIWSRSLVPMFTCTDARGHPVHACSVADLLSATELGIISEMDRALDRLSRVTDALASERGG